MNSNVISVNKGPVRIVTLTRSLPTASKTLNAPSQPPPPSSTIGLLKSKSSCFGLMTSDLNNELKNRLKSSEHATVTNLRKSCTTNDTRTSLETDQTTTTLHDDTVSLVRNLSSLGKKLPMEHRLASSDGDNINNEPEIASTSEGESSGGREISEIIKNSAVARRRKLADGK
uniref:Uncharacterized protein n=1 Tax=Glossina brevipalpis TaxID=37001 RepID=A0A1A9X0G3_9MUSC